MQPRKLLLLALRNPAGLRFDELVKLAEAFGFYTARITGSHHTMKYPSLGVILNLQPKHGLAKPYQVKQLLKIVEENRLQLIND
jgi:predicted RNA binding protein YcfA (HicA-like mRNA interferase family)